MGEIIQFVQTYELERARLIREARAIYDSVFPRFDPNREYRDRASMSHIRVSTNVHRGEGILS